MEKKFDITAILRVMALFSLVILLFGCGVTDQVSTAGTDPDTKQIASEDSIEEGHRDCWQGAVVGTIYQTTGKLTMSMYEHLTYGAMTFMMVAFAVWLAFQILKHVSSFTEESPAELWTEVFRKFFVCFVCGLLASSPDMVLYVLNYLVFPLYNAFLELGGAMIGHITKGDSHNSFLYIPFTGEVSANYDIACKASSVAKASLDGFPNGPQQMMECMTCSVGERLNFGLKLGWVVMKQKGIMAFFCGLILMIVFFIVKLGFAFYLVDAIFRFALMVMIMPLLIMSYAFKATKSWAKQGLFTIINSAAFMMMIAIVMIMIFSATQRLLTEQKEILEDKGSFADFSVPFIVLLLIAFLTVGAMNVAKQFADKLVGGGGQMKFQKTYGKMVMGLGKKAFTLTTGGAWKLALSKSSTLRGWHDKAGAAYAKMQSFAGRDSK